MLSFALDGAVFMFPECHPLLTGESSLYSKSSTGNLWTSELIFEALSANEKCTSAAGC
jgi:hypothetical protein